MEGWRQRRLGSKAKDPQSKNKTVLTLTGLLMEGLSGISNLSVIQHILRSPVSWDRFPLKARN
jgi:hypothetical protein